MRTLCDDGFTVLLETSGALDISPVDPRVHRIVDLKCPSSAESASNRYDNLRLLRATDELKLVVGTVQDYEWTVARLREYALDRLCPVLFSWVSAAEGRKWSELVAEITAQVREFNERVSRWIYLVKSYKVECLTVNRADMVKTKEEPKKDEPKKEELASMSTHGL